MVYPDNEIILDSEVPIEITVVFDSIDTSEVSDAPSKPLSFETIMIFKTDIEVLPKFRIPISGTLVDVFIANPDVRRNRIPN
jgi:hypothetical protein